jgi:hypothetical protein
LTAASFLAGTRKGIEMCDPYTPWGDRATDESMRPISSHTYGLNRMEMQELRAASEEEARSRDGPTVMLAKVEKHFRNVKRTTAREASRSLSIRLADARQCISRLVNAGKLERDGTTWEGRAGEGHRYAAAYQWIGEDK